MKKINRFFNWLENLMIVTAFTDAGEYETAKNIMSDRVKDDRKHKEKVIGRKKVPKPTNIRVRKPEVTYLNVF